MVVTEQMIYNRFFIDVFIFILYRNVDNIYVDNKQCKYLGSNVTHKLFFLQSKTNIFFSRKGIYYYGMLFLFLPANKIVTKLSQKAKAK